MSKEYPLYPELPEKAQEEAQKLIDKFKEEMKKAADETIGNLYCELTHYIESDSWGNFRKDLMDGFKDYDNRKIQAAYDFKTIRQSILKHHKEDIINDLNQDLLEEVELLKKQLAESRAYINRRES